jgi:LuxR family transcriptional regulator
MGVATDTDALTRIVKSTNIAQTWRQFARAMINLGFDMQLYGCSHLSPRAGWGLDETLVLMNGPDDYPEQFLSEQLHRNSLTFEWALQNDGFVSWAEALRQFRVHPSPKTTEIYNLNAEFGFQSGYIGSLSSVVPGTKGVVGLSSSRALSEREMDELWASVGSQVEALCATMHLRMSCLPQTGIFKPLTSRQLEVLYWYAEGKMLQDIATIMDISMGTVEKHLRCARESLEAETTAHAVRKATSLNLLTA